MKRLRILHSTSTSCTREACELAELLERNGIFSVLVGFTHGPGEPITDQKICMALAHPLIDAPILPKPGPHAYISGIKKARENLDLIKRYCAII